MNEDTRLLTETVIELVRQEAWDDLARVLREQPPEALADLLEHVDSETREHAFALLPPFLQGEVAGLVQEAVREDLLEEIPTEQLTEIVADLDSDEAVPLLEETRPEVTDEVLRRLQTLDPDEAGELRELLGYPEGTAGRDMTLNPPAVRIDATLGQAIEHLRRHAEEFREIQVVFVVAPAGRLRGYLPLHVLLLNPPDTPVIEVMRRDITFVYTYEDREQAAARAARAHLPAIPVIDSRGVLRGQITQDRLREIVEEETSEDMYRMVGLSEDESVFTPFRISLRKRLPWLYVNLATAILAAWVISLFEETIARVAVLAALQSIVAGQGGNAGVQTLTIIVRGLALGELDWRNVRRTFWKELGLGVANGVAVGAVIGALVWAWQGNPWLGVIIGAAMLLNMIAAALAGFGVPLILKSLRLDPAQASGVFVTTVTDVCGFFFFLSLATLMLPLIR